MEESLRKLYQKRIWIYCAIAFGLAYALAAVIWLSGGLTESPQMAEGLTYAFVLMLAYMMTPAIANLLTRSITHEGWRNMALVPHFKKGWLYWVIAWLGTPLLIGLGIVVYFFFFPQYFDRELTMMADLIASSGVTAEQMGSMPLMMVLLVQTLQAVLIAPILNVLPILGEEFGWRAYLQPKLIELYGPKKGLVLTGIVWGLWHAPIIAMGYNYGNYDLQYFGAPWTGILMMTLATVWLGIFFGWLTYKARSVWPAVIGHGSLNGVAGVVVFMTTGAPLLLLGPSAVGLIGGIGFIIVSALIMAIPGAFRLPVEPSES